MDIINVNILTRYQSLYNYNLNNININCIFKYIIDNSLIGNKWFTIPKTLILIISI